EDSHAVAELVFHAAAAMPGVLGDVLELASAAAEAIYGKPVKRARQRQPHDATPVDPIGPFPFLDIRIRANAQITGEEIIDPKPAAAVVFTVAKAVASRVRPERIQPQLMVGERLIG